MLWSWYHVFCLWSEDSEESGEPNYLECDDASGYLTFHKVNYFWSLVLSYASVLCSFVPDSPTQCAQN